MPFASKTGVILIYKLALHLKSTFLAFYRIDDWKLNWGFSCTCRDRNTAIRKLLTKNLES